MTYVFDMQLHKVQIPCEMREWSERFPVHGPERQRAMAELHAWRDGDGPNTAGYMPTVLLAPKPRKSWPDAFSAMNGLLVVSKAAKDVIEELDRAIHQFFPLKLQTKRGIEIEGPWFAMNVHAKQDSIVIEKSRVNVSARAPERLNSFWGSTKDGDVVVDPAKQRGLNLWREERFMGSLLGSDALVESLKENGVRFFSTIKAANVPYN